MKDDGTEQTQITTGFDDIIEPRWSPKGSGKWIIFAARTPAAGKVISNYNIYRILADGSSKTPEQLTVNEAEDTSPVIDRNSQFLYFRSNRGGTWNIWRMAWKE
jgi:Tol biopolymer transport system component